MDSKTIKSRMDSTISYFENKPKRKKDTFVMIGWTSADRLDYPTRYEFKPMEPLDECWATMKIADDNIENFTKMSKQGRKGGADELDVIHWMITRYYQNVLGLQIYLKVLVLKVKILSCVIARE